MCFMMKVKMCSLVTLAINFLLMVNRLFFDIILEIHQIFINILGNSNKFTPSFGKIEFTINEEIKDQLSTEMNYYVIGEITDDNTVEIVLSNGQIEKISSRGYQHLK